MEMVELRRIFLLLLLSTLLSSCGRPTPQAYVNLSDLDPTLAAGASGISPRPVLRVGLSLVLSPRETLLRYGPLIDYLSRRLNRHVEVVLPRSQTDLLDQLRLGGVHLGFMSSYGYLIAQGESAVKAVAAPVYDGSPSHRGYILVRRYSGLDQIAHLKGHTFAYTDPLSVTGRLYPEALVAGLGESVPRFFDRTIYTTSDDKAIKALDQGLVDGAAVSSIIYNLAVLHEPDLARRLRVIEESVPLGAPPVVVSMHMGSALQEQVREVLLAMADDEEGRKVLAALYVERFVEPDPALYEPVADLAAKVGVKR